MAIHYEVYCHRCGWFSKPSNLCGSSMTQKEEAIAEAKLHCQSVPVYSGISKHSDFTLVKITRDHTSFSLEE